MIKAFALIVFVFSCLFAHIAIGQQLRIHWDQANRNSADPAVDADFWPHANFMEIRVGQPDGKLPMVFAGDKTNSFKELPPGTRYLIPAEIAQDDISDNTFTIRMYPGAGHTEDAIINFTTNNDPNSQLSDFALGYGIYWIKFRLPYHSCAGDFDSWQEFTVVLDLQDSNYPYPGIDNDIVLNFDVKHADLNCPNICQLNLTMTSPLQNGQIQEIFKYGPYHTIQADSTYFFYDPPLPDTVIRYWNVLVVDEIFDQPTKGTDFRVAHLITEGLDQGISTDDEIYLNIPSVLEGMTHNLNSIKDSTGSTFSKFTITEQYIDEHYMRIFYPCQYYVAGRPTFAGDQYSSLTAVSSYGNALRFNVEPSDAAPGATGLKFEGKVNVTLDHAYFDLGAPIWYVGGSTSTSTNFDSRLDISNCWLRPCATYADMPPDERTPFAIKIKDVKANLQTNIIQSHGYNNVDYLAYQTGLIAEGNVRGTKLHDNQILAFNGYGIELISITPVEGEASEWPGYKRIFFHDNYVWNNYMGGVFIHDAETRAHFWENDFIANGYLSDAIPEHAGNGICLLEGAHVVLQENNFDVNRGAGLGIMDGATVDGWSDPIYSEHPIDFGENCFSENFWNVFLRGSTVHLGAPDGSDVKGQYNSFVAPRMPYPGSSYNCQAVGFDYSSVYLLENFFENPDLSAGSTVVVTRPAGAILQASQVAPGGDVSPPCSDFVAQPVLIQSPSSQNIDLVEAAIASYVSGDWGALRDASQALLSSGPDTSEVGVACSYLIRAANMLNDSALVREVYDYALLNSTSIFGQTAFQYAVLGYDMFRNYSYSCSIADIMIATYPGTNAARFGLTHNSLSYAHRSNNYTVAEDYLSSLVQSYPDFETMMVYYSIEGTLPPGMPKTGRGQQSNVNTPPVYGLHQNFPNPFNPSTVIRYDVPIPSQVQISIYNQLGRKIQTLKDAWHERGEYSCEFNGNRLPNGVYFYRLQAGEYTETRQMVLMK